MNYKTKSSDHILILLAFMPVVALIFSTNNTISKAVLVFESALLLFLYRKNFNGFTGRTLPFMCMNFLSLIITICYYSPIGSAIIFFNTILSFKVFNNISINKKTFLLVHLTQGAFLSLYLFMIKRPLYFGNSIVDGFGNRINTNLISILYFGAFLHISCVIFSVISNFKWRTIILCVCALIYGTNVWLYEARSAMISMIVFIAIIVTKKQGINYYKYKKICTILLLLTLLFPFVYMALINRVENPVFLGKSIATRVNVWGDCINLIKEHFIFGCGNGISVTMNAYGESTVSMHNTALSLWKILGIVPTAIFLTYCINHDNERFDNNKNIYAQAAFISTLLVCFFESFYTEELLYMAFLPFLIVNIQEDKEEKHE